jgi:hypothetical protein
MMILWKKLIATLRFLDKLKRLCTDQAISEKRNLSFSPRKKRKKATAEEGDTRNDQSKLKIGFLHYLNCYSDICMVINVLTELTDSSSEFKKNLGIINRHFQEVHKMLCQTKRFLISVDLNIAELSGPSQLR